VPVTTILPNSDINGTWIRNPASGTRWDKLADANVTTFISSPALGAQVYQGIDFGSFTVLGTQRIRAIRVKCDYRFNNQGYFTIKVIRFGLSTATTAIIQQSSVATAGGPVYSPWMSTDPGGYEWNQGSLDTFSARLYDNATTGSDRIRASELSAEVDVRNQPTLAAPTVTLNTTSSRPRVDWVYSDVDGEDQSAWELKIFSAAQYGASGFNPSTSTSSYASGTKLNTGAYWVLDKDLINGVTYEAFVRVAKQFNGQRWFSAWTPSSPFTMAYEPIPAPSITVTSDNTVPHVRNQLVVDTKLNVLTSDDASFEASIGSWVNVSNSTVVTSAAQVLKGAQSLRATATATADMVFSTGFYPAHPGRSYTFLGSYRAAVTGRSCRLEAIWYDGANVQVGATSTGGNVTDTTAGWTQATLTASCPVGAVQFKLFGRVLVPVAGEQHFFDAISASTSSSTTWFAGGASTVDVTFIEYTDLSTSYGPIINLLTPQLALGGEDTLSTDGFYVRSAKDLVRFVRDQNFLGEGSIRWDVGNAAGSLLDIGAVNGAYDPLYTLPCVPGVQYTLSYYVRAGSGSHSLRLVLNSIDQTGAIVGSSTNGSTVAGIGTTWTRLTVTHTGQTGAIGMRASLENVNGDLVDYYLDGGQLEEGASATVWHQGQGASPAWQTVRGALTALSADQRSQLATCWDREAPPGVHRLYRAATIAAYPSGTNGASPASTWVAARLALLDGGQSAVLKDPNDPAHDLRIRIPAISERISEDVAEYHPIRPSAVQAFGQRSVITSDWISGVGGSITVQISDDLDWYRLLQLMETPGALLLQFPEGGQRYVRLTGDRSWTRDPIGTDGRMSRPSRYLREVNLSFVEVARPPVLA
jgi:hypothetical protein